MGTLNVVQMCARLFFDGSRQLTRMSAMRVGSHFASYHCTSPLFWQKDNGAKPVERRRRSALTSSGLRPRPAVSDGWKSHDGWKDHVQFKGLQGDPKTPATSKKMSKTLGPILKQKKPSIDSRVSPELRKLTLEDSPRERETLKRAIKDSREDMNYETLFGVAPCLLALTQGRRKAHSLHVKEGESYRKGSVHQVCEEARSRGVQVQRASKRDLDRMSSGGVHQGLCLQASPLGYLTEEKSSQPLTDSSKTPLWLVLDGVQDPMNLGAILRSAYFLGVDRVVSSVRNSCPLTPVVSKASSGVMEVMGVYGCESLTDMIKVKVAQGWQVIGTVGAEAADPRLPTTRCSDFHMTKPSLLLMGGEGAGLSPELRLQCEALLTIPPRRDLHPGVDSLNVSVATGILLHSLLSSRRGGHR